MAMFSLDGQRIQRISLIDIDSVHSHVTAPSEGAKNHGWSGCGVYIAMFLYCNYVCINCRYTMRIQLHLVGGNHSGEHERCIRCATFPSNCYCVKFQSGCLTIKHSVQVRTL